MFIFLRNISQREKEELHCCSACGWDWTTCCWFQLVKCPKLAAASSSRFSKHSIWFSFSAEATLPIRCRSELLQSQMSPSDWKNRKMTNMICTCTCVLRWNQKRKKTASKAFLPLLQSHIYPQRCVAVFWLHSVSVNLQGSRSACFVSPARTPQPKLGFGLLTRCPCCLWIPCSRPHLDSACLWCLARALPRLRAPEFSAARNWLLFIQKKTTHKKNNKINNEGMHHHNADTNKKYILGSFLSRNWHDKLFPWTQYCKGGGLKSVHSTWLPQHIPNENIWWLNRECCAPFRKTNLCALLHCWRLQFRKRRSKGSVSACQHQISQRRSSPFDKFFVPCDIQCPLSRQAFSSGFQHCSE